MRTKVFTLIVSILLPVTSFAQDDLYFTPSKESVKAMKDAKQTEYDRTHGNYYIGRDVSVDEYNRRYRNKLKSEYAVVDGDSVLVNDIIDFRPRPADGSDTLVVDTIYNDDDFQNSYELSRWVDDYYCGYRPWFRPYNYWGVRYYGWYDPWYSPFWDPWYDPWFDPWFGPSWAWDPWYYDRWYWYSGYWHGGYYPYYSNVHYISGGGGMNGRNPSIRSGYGPRNDAQRRDSHFYANHSRSGSYGANKGTSYSIAQRNGGTSSGNRGGSSYVQRSSSWGHSTFRDTGYSSSRYTGTSSSGSSSNRSSSFSSHSSGNSSQSYGNSSRSYSSSSSSHSSSSGSFSSGSSGSSHSGGSSGGGFSGGGSHGGGGFGSHRR